MMVILLMRSLPAQSIILYWHSSEINLPVQTKHGVLPLFIPHTILMYRKRGITASKATSTRRSRRAAAWYTRVSLPHMEKNVHLQS